MAAEATGTLTLEVAPRGEWKDELYSEQSAEFDLRLRNQGSSPVTALNLYGSYDFPRFSLLFENGAEMGPYTKGNQYERKVGDLIRKEPPRPGRSAIPAGGATGISFNVWGYRDPLPPGSYGVRAEHQTTAGGPLVRSAVYKFRIKPAKIVSMALGYDSAQRISSVLAWLAANAESPGKARLLIRVSAPKGHQAPLQGATSHGEFPTKSMVAVGDLIPGAKTGPGGWAGVCSAGEAMMIRHNMSYPSWRTEALPVPFSNPIPVPRFPDMGGKALFLMTGDTPQGPALAGILAENRRGIAARWQTPLKSVPTLSACRYGTDGRVTVLLAANDGKSCRMSLIEVDPTAGLSKAEKPVRQSENEAIAVVSAVDGFYVLLAGLAQANKLTLFKISDAGKSDLVFSKDVPNWPKDAKGKPARAMQAQLESEGPGSLLVSFVAEGAFYSGHLTPRLHLAKEHHDPESPASFGHVAVLGRGDTPACFDAAGMLHYFGKGGGH